MKFYLMSDIHNEFGKLELDACMGGKDDTLLLAGDIGVVAKPGTLIPFLVEASEKFKYVLGIPGNHEFYNGDFPGAVDKVRAAIVEHKLENVTYDHKFVSKIDDITVIAATLWTNFRNDYVCKNVSERSINDFRAILTRHGGQFIRFSTDLAAAIFKDHYQFIKDNLVQGEISLVMTHFAPALGSVHSKYAGDIINGYFVNDLENDIILMGEKDIYPKVWVHGHVHNCFDYKVGKTRVIANPRGYPGEQREFEINKHFWI